MEFMLKQGTLTIPCKLSEPANGSPRRVVLGVHGLGGCAEDPIQAGIAEEMALFQYATIRFDFPAHGKNPEDAFRLKDCVDTLLAVAGWAKQRYPDVEDLCIFATGFGAYVTLVALDALLELPGKCKLVLQTPNVRMSETLLTMIRRTKQTLRAMGQCTIPTPRPISITYDFYAELEQNPVQTVCPIPMLILHGEEDAYIRDSDIQQFRQINEQAKLVIIPGATHQFQEDGAWDMVLDLTRDWFAFEQVLLADWD